MGDRCYMQVTVAREYAHLFKEIGFNDDLDDLSSPVAELYMEEANYALGVGTGEGDDGFGDELPRGIPYYGSHESGGEYGPGAFATLGDRMILVDKLHDGQIAAPITIDDSGMPFVEREDFAHIQCFLVVRRKVEEIHDKLIASAKPAQPQP